MDMYEMGVERITASSTEHRKDSANAPKRYNNMYSIKITSEMICQEIDMIYKKTNLLFYSRNTQNTLRGKTRILDGMYLTNKFKFIFCRIVMQLL